MSLGEKSDLRSKSKSLDYIKSLTSESDDATTGVRRGFIGPFDDFSHAEMILECDAPANWKSLETFQGPHTLAYHSYELMCIVTYSEGDVTLELCSDEYQFANCLYRHRSFFAEMRG